MRDAGLIVGDTLVMDATLLKANASLDSLVSRSLHTQLSSTQTYLDQLWAENPTGDADGADETSEPTSVPTRREGTKKTAAELRANERRVSKTDPDSAIVVKDLYALFWSRRRVQAIRERRTAPKPRSALNRREPGPRLLRTVQNPASP